MKSKRIRKIIPEIRKKLDTLEGDCEYSVLGVKVSGNRRHLKRFDECGDLKSAKEVAKSILDAKTNGLLSEDMLADLRQKREEVENNLKG